MWVPARGREELCGRSWALATGPQPQAQTGSQGGWVQADEANRGVQLSGLGVQSAIQKRNEESPSEGETEAQMDDSSLPRLGSSRVEIQAQSLPLASPECLAPNSRTSQLPRVPCSSSAQAVKLQAIALLFCLMCEHTPWEFTATAKKLIVERSPSTLCRVAITPGPPRASVMGTHRAAHPLLQAWNPSSKGLWVTGPDV